MGASLLSLSCSKKELQPADEPLVWAGRMADSQITKGIGGTNVDSPRFKWDYSAGVGLKSLLDLYELTGEKKYNDYVLSFADKVVSEDGTIKSYNVEEYNIDRVNTSKIFFRIYDQTGDEKYKQALDLTRTQFEGHPRNEDGGLWHKEIYPHQMWLDGIYMGAPFYAEYASRYGDSSDFQYIINWFRTLSLHCYDPSTDLYRHACDVSRQMPWADSVTGQSDHCWGRGMGWYFMGAVDALEFIPESEVGHGLVADTVKKLASMVKRMQDPVTGTWYQVIDRSGDEGNYLEATCTAMFTYSLLKAVRLGYIDDSYLDVAVKGFNGFVAQFISEGEDGLLNVSDCCMGAGLGGTPYRSGTYEYYIKEARRGPNSTFAMGPFVMAGVELARIRQ